MRINHDQHQWQLNGKSSRDGSAIRLHNSLEKNGQPPPLLESSKALLLPLYKKLDSFIKAMDKTRTGFKYPQ